jgi:hypothetical protein
MLQTTDTEMPYIDIRRNTLKSMGNPDESILNMIHILGSIGIDFDSRILIWAIGLWCLHASMCKHIQAGTRQEHGKNCGLSAANMAGTRQEHGRNTAG